jgi:uncharacterized protein (TIGR03435 family)
MPSINIVVFAIVASQAVLPAQPASPPGLRFDVASVKPNRTAACRGRWDFSTSHGTVIAENAPLLRIISRAYHLTDDRVSGPKWIDSQCYDIRAKASNKTPERDLMRMLQGLLMERFHLVAQLEPAERQILALVVDKGGSKMHPYGDPISMPAIDDGRVLFMARHMPDLCERIGKVTGRPVVDKTGLHGDYSIVLTYALFESTDGNPSDAESDIFSAVRNQLGLKLEAQRGVVDILKIAGVDKVPMEN